MRDITLLHPKVQELAKKLVDECAKKGLLIKITETMRTKEEQNALYAKGRTAPGNIVTKVQYPSSNHNWGIAFDFCRNDGTGAYEIKGNFFQKVGEIGKSLGLSWGGDFKSFKDMPHFEYTKFGNWRELQAKYKTPENFTKTFSNVHKIKVKNIKTTERQSQK